MPVINGIVKRGMDMSPLASFESYSGLGFPEAASVATLRSIAHMFGASKNRCGIYLLQFPDNKFYVGQAVDVVRRFSQHRKNYDDILGFSFIPTPRKLLDEIERNLIYKAEQLELLILNTVHATNVVGETDLDLILSPEQQDFWLSSPESFNCSEVSVSPITLSQAHLERFWRQFQKFKAHPLFSPASELMQIYLANCIPSPRRTEYSFWAVSCLPTTNHNTWPRLACVNIGVMEALVIGCFKECPTKLWGFLTVASDVLYETYQNAETFIAAFPSIEVIQRNYKDAGQYQVTLWAEDEKSLKLLLANAAIRKAAAALALRVMRKRATIYSKYHCKQLADLVVMGN